MNIENKIGDSRQKRVLFSSISGIIFSIISLIFSFVLRKIFLTKIGVEYLGLYTFLTGIFGLLTTVDGGVCSSLFIKIHKPIAENNIAEIRRSYKLIKIVYMIRAALVLLIGIILFFLLNWLASDVIIPIKEVKIAYLIYLFLNAISYLFIYNEFLLEAYQKRYLTNIYLFVVSITFTIINGIFLFLVGNFYVYLVIQVLINLVSYILCTFAVKKRYPFLFTKIKLDMSSSAEIKDMFKITYYTLSSVIVRNTDNILITKLLGFTTNGIYSSYKMLNSQIFNLLGKIKYSAQDSTRNYLVVKDKKSSLKMLSNLTFIYFWLAGFCTIALSALSTPFIILWLGSNYTLGIIPIFLTALTLFIEMLIFPYDDAFYSLELYKKNKYIPIVEIFINLSISIILGIYFGITGIMIGTLSYLLFKSFIRIKMIMKNYYEISYIKVLLKFIFYIFIVIISFSITYYILSFISGKDLLSFVYKVLITAILPNIIITLFTFWTDEFRWVINLVKKYLKKS